MMKTKFYHLLLLLFSLTLFSCDQILDNYWDRKAEENYVSPFKGIYKGNYSGDEVGTLSIEVAKNGYTSVTRIAAFGTEESTFSGMVRDDGALQSVKLESGFTLLGNLNAKSGTWKMGDWNGSWTVQKQ
ncbi:hypothetical protein FIC_01957 [Flavobacteriaceae bacterium 3519-10]|nr:hypothetical protein FIC_01957 [Flavobacteriaceae bacterium 3519-10]